MHPKKRPSEIDVDNPLPFGKREVDKQIPINNPGIIDEHMHAPEFGYGSVDDAPPIIGFSHIKMLKPSSAPQLRSEHFPFAFKHVPNNDSPAFSDDPASMRGPHPSCPTGDNNNFPS
ncbi:hypothetical protein GCM10011591_43600 [Nocardia camponoti]|uniref:Uncharacterized protein n=1 Tax=Nocardia camponoti TaxID=1616106 RepID=A0A917VDS6_9NOCA|nr:hypothetical protein GCM10011591_43600 [Nocardia camponoti]